MQQLESKLVGELSEKESPMSIENVWSKMEKDGAPRGCDSGQGKTKRENG